jgi:hypothetical protein
MTSGLYKLQTQTPPRFYLCAQLSPINWYRDSPLHVDTYRMFPIPEGSVISDTRPPSRLYVARGQPQCATY